MSDPAAELRHKDHGERLGDLETRLDAAQATQAKSETWRTGDDLPHRGAEARILGLEEHREKCDQVGVIAKFPELRRAFYELKERALTMDDVTGLIDQAVARTVGAAATAKATGWSALAKVLTAIGAILTPIGVAILAIVQLGKP
jgi:hypothetical protein